MKYNVGDIIKFPDSRDYMMIVQTEEESIKSHGKYIIERITTGDRIIYTKWYIENLTDFVQGSANEI